MRKLLLIFTIILGATQLSFGQYYIDYGVSVGVSNYLGDLGGSGEGASRPGIADIQLSTSRWTLGGFYRYRVAPNIALKGTLQYIRLRGDDTKTGNPARRARNLDFTNDMYELTANGELYLLKVNDVGRTGRYGVGLFYSNPKGENIITGETVSLQSLQTEGVSYSKFNFVIPAGLGFYYTLNRRYRVGMEIGWRTTFTDYIDDVSDLYVSGFDGISNKTDQELIDGLNITSNNFKEGSRRGNPNDNDSYITATFNFSWTLRGSSKFYKSRHSWVLGRNKRRSRKSRAKF